MNENEKVAGTAPLEFCRICWCLVHLQAHTIAKCDQLKSISFSLYDGEEQAVIPKAFYDAFNEEQQA